MNLRSLQKPLKDKYRAEPSTSRITLTARGAETGAPIACSVDIGRAVSRPRPTRASGVRERARARAISSSARSPRACR